MEHDRDERLAFGIPPISHPDEDTPRLAYADWLQENDREGDAHFIRDMIQAGATIFASEHGSSWTEPDYPVYRGRPGFVANVRAIRALIRADRRAIAAGRTSLSTRAPWLPPTTRSRNRSPEVAGR